MKTALTSTRTHRLAAHNGSGFTLIELMITVVILGIIASIALPSYQQQVRKTKRSDAKSALTELVNRQEKYFSQCLVYTNLVDKPFPVNKNDCGVNAGLGASTSSKDNLYTLSATFVAGPPSTYVLTATAVATKSQNNDTGCTVLTINSAGLKTPASGCW